MFIERRNYVHPMLYEDLLTVVNRLGERIGVLGKEIESIAELKR